MKLYFTGKPKRKYYDDPFAVRCPKCRGNYDKKIYDSETCKKCGAKMMPVKCYHITSSGNSELTN